jgi:uncharacterized protein (DUF302 family)
MMIITLMHDVGRGKFSQQGRNCHHNSILNSVNPLNLIVMAHYSCKLRIPFQQALNKVTQNLQQQGFGIITTIDVQDTFKQKLNVNFRNYKILGACNPQFAYKAISLESHMGVMMPCNIVVQEHENGEVEVSAVNPLENIDRAFSTTQLVDLATEVGDKLRAALDDLHRDVPEARAEALPTGRS